MNKKCETQKQSKLLSLQKQWLCWAVHSTQPQKTWEKLNPSIIPFYTYTYVSVSVTLEPFTGSVGVKL